MADHIWISATTSDWATAGNWTGGVPVSNGRALLGASSSQVSLLTTVTQGGVDLDLLEASSLFAGNLGSAGTPLEIAADVVNWFGSGELHYLSHNNAGALKTDVMNLRSANPGVGGTIGSKVGAAGEIDVLNFARGTWTITNAQGINRLCTSYVTNPSGDVALTVNNATGTIAEARFAAGNIQNNALITACNVAGQARLTHGTAAITPAGTITNLFMADRSYCAFNMAATIGLVVLDGESILDLMQTGHVKVITEIYLLGRSKLLAGSNVTLPTGALYHDLRETK